MKKFEKFAENALSKNEIKSVKGGTLYQCTCMSGSHSGSMFVWSDLDRNPGDFQSYSNAVCEGGDSQCTSRLIRLPEY